MSDEDEAFALFLAKYRWVFLQVLHDLRAAHLAEVDEALDDPERLLAASERLGALVKKKLADMGKPDTAVDTVAVRLIARDIYEQFGSKLVLSL